MYTGLMIGLLVLGAMASATAAWALAALRLGRIGGTILASIVGGAAVAVYRLAVRPWHLGWGATDEEVARSMPSDDLLPGSGSATRAITIEAPPEDIWPWLVQLGYGRAGWYSYDWIDNDFKPSADRVLMMPGMGFEAQAVDEPRSIVSLLEDGSTFWCLALYPADDGSTRLVSRWRPRSERSVATFFMVLVVEPGTFVMEQKLLRTIRDRVESSSTRSTVRERAR